MQIFETRESNVRSYVRSFPTVFAKSQGAILTAEDGKEYIDFFCGAGVLNYGHNPVGMKKAMIKYLEDDGFIHSLDMATVAKRTFMESFVKTILEPRQLDYKLQFTGPTGTNAVEAALKLARKVTGRQPVVSFTHSFHGMTLGSMAVSFAAAKNVEVGVDVEHGLTLPFDGFLGEGVDTLNYVETFLKINQAKNDLPAAFILETIQCEGGINVASFDWLKGLKALLDEYGVLLIVDDIQAGCGRSGSFFSFEKVGIVPDMVCLSKSLSGFGLPMAMLLLKPELDAWNPGEHSGTFRGHNLAFITATEALKYWKDDSFAKQIAAKSAIVEARLSGMLERFPKLEGKIRGRGMVWGLEAANSEWASCISKEAFKIGIIIETAGPDDKVLKFLPPLVIPTEQLQTGFDKIEEAAEILCQSHK